MLHKDYRYQSLDWITEERVGVVLQAGVIQFDEMRDLSFPLPSVTAMCLHIAYANWMESQQLLQEENFLESPKPLSSQTTVSLKEDEIFFDLIQKRMIAIVFAYTALESFANETIPDHFVFRGKNRDKNRTEKYREYTKEQTERLSLDIKLGEVLPKIFNLDNPKGGTIWKKYLLLKGVRDRIIHMKSKDRRSLIPGEENIWKELLSQSFPNVAIEANEVIGFYLSSIGEKDRPLWYMKFPVKE
jgi:hypothetical protein